MKTIVYISVLSLLPVLAAAQISSLRTASPLPDPARLQALTAQLSAAHQTSRTAALQWAAQRALPVQGQGWALTGMAGGVPQYTGSENAAAAAVVGADVLATVPGLDGSGVRIGYWEVGRPVLPHVELGNLTWQEPNSPAAFSHHANHVAGTVIAVGKNGAARGMAPGASLRGWDAFNDLAEMAAAASAAPAQAIMLSNHSYGPFSGWNNFPQQRGVRGPSGNFGWHWFGSGFQTRECFELGQYGAQAAEMDAVCALLPDYQPFWAAANERDDGPPANGAQFFVNQGGGWTAQNYGSGVHPPGDGSAGGGLGWDTLSSRACAKNIIAVGAWDPATRAMTPFSSYGPADDGRLKPDIVAPGAGLLSAFATAADGYGNMGGTSMASPVAMGCAALLQEMAQARLGSTMRASLLKALLLHTADDILIAGPDYLSGFGLLNAPRARDLIQQQADHPHAPVLVNDVLPEGATRQFHIIVPAGVPELRATLCWTDPAGTAQNSLDSPVRSLVNDLDLLITGPHTDSPVLAFKRPFAPDPANPQQPAPRARNSRDNTEQVLVENPAPGAYTVTVSHTGPITAPLGGNSQAFSLVMSGHQVANALDFWPDLPRLVRLVQRPTDPLASFDMHIANRTSGTLNLAILANAVADGISAIFVKTDPVLHPGAENTIRVSVTQTGAQYPPGVYQRTVRVQQIGSTFIWEIPVIVEIAAPVPSLTQQFPGGHDAACDLEYSQAEFIWDIPTQQYSARWRRLMPHERQLPRPAYTPGTVAFAPNAPDQTVEAPLDDWFYRVRRAVMHISPNGFISIGQDNAAAPSIPAHFALPRISGFFTNLAPEAGGVVTVEYPEGSAPRSEVIVTWSGVPAQHIGGSHTFQIHIAEENIRITWLELTSGSGIAGLSRGGGLPVPFAETNLSALPHLPPAGLSEPFFHPGTTDIRHGQLILHPVSDGVEHEYQRYFRPGVFSFPVPAHTGVPIAVQNGPGLHAAFNLAPPLPFFGVPCDSVEVIRNVGLSFYRAGEIIATFNCFNMAGIEGVPIPGTLRRHDLPDRFVITWDQYQTPGGEPLNLQTEIFYDGRLRVTWLDLPVNAGACYLSNRQVNELYDYHSSDITSFPLPPLPEVNVFTLAGHMAEGDATQRARLRVTRTGFTDHALFTALSIAPESTAAAGDFAGLATPVIIPAGASEVDITLSAVSDTLTEGPESLTLRFIVMGTVANGPQNEARFTILDKPVDAWLHQHGMTRTHLTLDADNDGRSNFEEYATGSDPLEPGLSGTPESSLAHHATTTTLHGSALLNPDASDVSAILQYSANLAQWTDGPPLAFPENGGLRAEASLTLSSVPQRLFTRVRFRLAP